MKKLFQITLLLFSIYAYAGDIDPDSEMGKAFNTESHELVTCASYYAVLSEAAKRSEGPDADELVIKMDDLKEYALRYALVFAETTQTKEMAENVTLERFKLELDAMGKEIERDFSNTSILMNKHGEPCMNKMKYPTAEFSEWLSIH